MNLLCRSIGGCSGSATGDLVGLGCSFRFRCLTAFSLLCRCGFILVVVVIAVSSRVAVVEFLGLTTLFSVLSRLVFVSTKFILQTKNICCNTLKSVNIFS